jgi:hypothetical protein
MRHSQNVSAYLPRLLLLIVVGEGLSAAQARPTFSGGTNVIQVDVQVVDKQGRPVTGLGPDQFSVAVAGKNRRVLSAAMVDASRNADPAAGPARMADPERAGAGEPAPIQTFVIAADALTFGADVSAGVASAMQAFVQAIPNTTPVGFMAFPLGPAVDPTTDRLALGRAIRDLRGCRSHRRPARSTFGTPMSSTTWPRASAAKSTPP